MEQPLCLEETLMTMTSVTPAFKGVSLILWDEDSQAFTASLSTLENQPQNLMARRARSEGATAKIIEGKRPLSVSNLSEGPCPPNPMLLKYDINAYSGFPLLFENTVHGVLYGLFTKRDNITNQDKSLIHSFSKVISEMLHLKKINNLLVKENSIDTLTKVGTRRYFENHANLILPPNYSNVVMMIDLDLFKNVNDSYGHLIGDVILQEMGYLMNSLFSSQGAVYRFGGEEFVVLLTNTSLEEGIQRAEQLRLAVARNKIITPRGVIKCTISIGLTTTEIGDVDVQSSIAEADHALYAAKEAGRNQSWYWQGDMALPISNFSDQALMVS
jgi:diguanylate cyclase (GGDEF)-like protein